jgi:putative pyrroloquinoline-quinone binding quinoprotein
MARRWRTGMGRGLLVVGAAFLCAGSITAPAPGRPAVHPTWLARYGSPAHGFDSASAAAVSPDGLRVLVTGTSDRPATSSDYATIAYDAATGAQAWLARFNGPGNGVDQANAISTSPDGSRVYVTGQSGSALGNVYATVAYDAGTGARVWAKEYGGVGVGEDAASALGVSPDSSKVFVTGRSRGAMNGDDYATVAYDATTGAELWVARYTTVGSNEDYATALAVSADGARIYVTGYANGDYGTMAYATATGALDWSIQYDGGEFDTPNALAISPDDALVYVTGLVGTNGGDYATVAYAATSGSRVWAKRYSGLTATSLDTATAVGVAPDGSAVYVTGASATDIATVAYDGLTGAQLWVSRFTNGGAVAMGLRPDGLVVYVAGSGRSSSSDFDYIAAAYDSATGGQLWSVRNGRRGQDFLADLAVGPAGGAIYLTGNFGSPAGGSDADYVTVAYEV